MVGAALRKKTKPQKIVILEHPEKVNSQQCPHAIIWVSSSRNNVKMMWEIVDEVVVDAVQYIHNETYNV